MYNPDTRKITQYRKGKKGCEEIISDNIYCSFMDSRKRIHETGGLSIPSADVDFEHEEAGIEYRFSTGGHTAAMVPVYLYGTGSERINGVLDNTELARMLKWLVLPDSGRIANVPD